jgi:hypothetical protein
MHACMTHAGDGHTPHKVNLVFRRVDTVQIVGHLRLGVLHHGQSCAVIVKVHRIGMLPDPVGSENL